MASPVKIMRHLRPLYIKTRIEDQLINQVLEDNGAAVNMLLVSIIKKINKDEHDLIPTE